MADSDYISVYRQFFEEFAKVSQTEEKGPMRVSVYSLSLDELVGEVMQSCVNYLSERKCPKGLIVPLTKMVVEEFINEANKQPNEVNDPLKLNNKTQSKIAEVCLRFTDNEKLSNLPGPVQETSYSTHWTKHTRRRMEDRLICLPRFNSLHSIQSNSEAGYYGIFDGHNGVNAANYAASHLHQYLAESEFYPDDPVRAFCQAIEKTEVRYNSKDENSGTTVLAILHQPIEKKLTVAWVGDSQAMLVNENSYVMLVDPHKPERKDERKRIEDMGGFISKVQTVYRVNGGLAISRAIGDKKLKPYVSAEPELRSLNLSGSEHFVVMGCDGLWDVVEPQQVIETVYFEIKKNEGQIDTVGRRLVDLAKENNSTDNISVIVIFLTDPAEICNRSVDLTGHRPKILLQDGVIMETNFQTSEKSPMNDPGINGIYETNGTHFDDPMRNESDDDFGPETNVDTIDDVLTSPKALNPFSGENNWQKSQPSDENPEKLIEFSRQEPLTIENEIMMFSEGFTESAKNLDEKSASELNNDINFDKFPVNNINPFENEIKNMSDPLDFSNSITDESNKYVAEINSKKEEIDNFMNSNFVDESSNIKNEADFLGEFQEKNSNRDAFGFVENCLNDFKENDFNQPEKDNMFNNDEMGELKIEKVEIPVVESPAQENSVPESVSESQIKEMPSDEMISHETHDMDATNKIEQFSDFSLKTNEEAVDFIPQNEPLDASGHPPAPCSVVDVVEAERASRDFQPVEENEIKKEAFTEELLSPSAPAFEGEVKDEIVAESGGEVDSEDDEWNYIKVESGVHQTAPAVNKDSDLVPSLNESSDIEKPTMNSPLNPEADEFIPVSSTIVSNEFNLNTTPIKAIPDHMTDIIASSPDWNNMNNVNVPEEADFLSEIKTKPSNIFDNFDPAHQESLIHQNTALDNNLSFISPGQTNKENEIEAVPREEPRGLDLSRDMTSSFIDPSTMSSNIETPESQHDFISTHQEGAIPETNWSAVNEPDFVIEEVSKSTSMPLSEEAFSPKSHTPDTPKSTEVEISKHSEPETVSPDFISSQPKPVVDSPIVETILSPTVTDQIDVKPEIHSEVVEAPKIPDILETPESSESPKVSEIPQSPEPPKTTEVPITPQSPEISETPVAPEIPVVPESVEKSPVEDKPNEAVSEGITETAAAAVAAAAATAVAGAAGVAATKKTVKKDTPKTTPSKTTKTAPATKPLVNGTKTSAPAKKPTTTTQPPKTSAPAKTTTSTLTKTTTSRVSAVNKTTAKPTATATTATNSTLNKVPARPRPASATSTVSKTSSPLKTTATTSLTKSTTAAPKTTTRTSTTTVGSVAPKPKPRVPATSTLNGDAKTTVKRTEITTKKANGTTGSTTTTTTRVSLTARPATAPAKPTTLKTTTTTTTTTRTVSAKPAPRSTVTSTTTAASPTSKVSPTARKTTIAPDKQAKEASNRLTSRTSTVTKTNGVLPGKTTTTTTKTKKTLTTSTTTPSKTKIDNKTETKAEQIVEEKITIIQTENETPLIDEKKFINLINSCNSD